VGTGGRGVFVASTYHPARGLTGLYREGKIVDPLPCPRFLRAPPVLTRPARPLARANPRCVILKPMAGSDLHQKMSGLYSVTSRS
jgi:hypothetical protein